MVDVCFNLNSQQISLTFAFSFSLLSILTENFDFFSSFTLEMMMMKEKWCAIWIVQFMLETRWGKEEKKLTKMGENLVMKIDAVKWWCIMFISHLSIWCLCQRQVLPLLLFSIANWRTIPPKWLRPQEFTRILCKVIRTRDCKPIYGAILLSFYLFRQNIFTQHWYRMSVIALGGAHECACVCVFVC